MQFGDFQLHIIKESEFKLDAGAMFGVVPKALWAKMTVPDADNRISLACNLLLIQSPHGNVLVETGMGPRWQDRERQRYDLKSLVDHNSVLESISLGNEDVDAVIISHLHFDHAGGAVVLKDGQLVPAFQNAKYYVQKGEWEYAQKANSRAKASYRGDDYLPLAQSGHLVLIDGDTEILPGIFVRVSGGHTKNHQIVTFESAGKKGAYFADIVPTKDHLNSAWTMAYDHFPLETCDAKTTFLQAAAKEEWLVVFDHEIDVPWGHVELNHGKFEWKALSELSLVPA